MAEYVLFTDSSVICPRTCQRAGLYVLPLTVKVDVKEYANYLDWRQIIVSYFYNLLRTAIRR
jgi:fatty acid-binding protein DegV